MADPQREPTGQHNVNVNVGDRGDVNTGQHPRINIGGGDAPLFPRWLIPGLLGLGGGGLGAFGVESARPQQPVVLRVELDPLVRRVDALETNQRALEAARQDDRLTQTRIADRLDELGRGMDDLKTLIKSRR